MDIAVVLEEKQSCLRLANINSTFAEILCWSGLCFLSGMVIKVSSC